MRELRWLDDKPLGRFEEHTTENATSACKPNCFGHYVFPIMLDMPVAHRIIYDLKAE